MAFPFDKSNLQLNMGFIFVKFPVGMSNRSYSYYRDL